MYTGDRVHGTYGYARTYVRRSFPVERALPVPNHQSYSARPSSTPRAIPFIKKQLIIKKIYIHLLLNNVGIFDGKKKNQSRSKRLIISGTRLGTCK